jgi:ABC-type phosphate/phosphonate transport system substrate-binding protein
VLLSPHDVELDELVHPDTHAVANSADSLSGWISLLNATVGPDGVWPGSVTYTSAHYESLLTLVRGDADLASIDGLSLRLIEAEQPDLLIGLHRVGLGPSIPTPAVVARRSTATDEIAALRSAFARAATDPALARARAALHVGGFVPLTLDDYRAILPLSTARP